MLIDRKKKTDDQNEETTTLRVDVTCRSADVSGRKRLLIDLLRAPSRPRPVRCTPARSDSTITWPSVSGTMGLKRNLNPN